MEAGTVGLIGELPETGMTSNTTLLSSQQFMLFYIAGNSPFNLRGHSHWRRAKATRLYQDETRKDLFLGIILLIHHFHVDHKATCLPHPTPPPKKKCLTIVFHLP